MQIEVKNISKKYGRKVVLDKVCLSAEAGQCVGLLGANGSGKSTLLGILAGVLSADGGEFLCDGKDLLKRGSNRALIGFVPQGTALIGELSAKDNLLLWYSKEKMEASLKSGVLNMLGIGDFLTLPVKKMSGGMKKRLSIGCAVAAAPPVLLMDEPCAALDLACKEEIRQYISRFCKAGGIVILSTHDEAEIRMCDKLYLVKNGNLSPYEYVSERAEAVRLSL